MKNCSMLLVVFGVSFRATATCPNMTMMLSETRLDSLSCFSAVNSRLETFATSAGTQYWSSAWAARSAMLRFSMAASRNASNASWEDLVRPRGFVE
uniref:Putative secreted peptide n=1 Tax=Anopheles braziliensis TaxID=58242 RepID=A0A2M3ZT12_9DIPT